MTLQSPSSIVDVHMAEMSRYRDTIHTLSDDILTMRAQIRDLELNNTQLRRGVTGFNEFTLISTESEEHVQSLDKKQLALKYSKSSLHIATSRSLAYILQPVEYSAIMLLLVLLLELLH